MFFKSGVSNFSKKALVAALAAMSCVQQVAAEDGRKSEMSVAVVTVTGCLFVLAMCCCNQLISRHRRQPDGSRPNEVEVSIESPLLTSPVSKPSVSTPRI